MKVIILPKRIYRFIAISIKMPMPFSIELEQKKFKFGQKHRRQQKNKTILRKRNRTGGIMFSDFRIYY